MLEHPGLWSSNSKHRRVREGQQSTAASVGVMSTPPGMVYETQVEKKITSFFIC